MNDCCSDYIPTDFTVDCDNTDVYTRNVPAFIFENGRMYDKNYRYMYTGTLEGNLITVNPLAEHPTMLEIAEEVKILKKALRKKG